LTYKVVSLTEFVEATQPYWYAHWQEVGINQNIIPLDVDLDVYRAIEKAGSLVCILAYDEDVPVGYMIWFTRTNPRYKTSLSGITDIFWLHPEYRKGRHGLRMFQFAEQVLKGMGCQRLFGSCKVEHDLESLYLGLGFTPFEKSFTKLLSE